MSNEGIKKIFATPLDTADDSDKEGVGVLRFEGGKVFKYVKYLSGTGNVTPAANDVCYWNDYDNGEVTCDLSDTNEVGAGVLQAALTDTQFGWIQIAGIASINTDVTAGAVGDLLTAAGAGDKTLDLNEWSGTSPNIVPNGPTVAVLEDATAGAQKIHCMFPW